MSETRLDAFERMAHDLLDNPEFSIQFETSPTPRLGSSRFTGAASSRKEVTTVHVNHSGGTEGLHRLEDRHEDATLAWSETQRLPGGMQQTKGEFAIVGDPHAEYDPSPTASMSGSTSGSGSSTSSESGSASGGLGKPMTDEDGDESDTPERVWGDGLSNPPEPSRRFAELDGTRHVVADRPEETDHGPFVCEEQEMADDTSGIKLNYDSLIDFAADEDLCETCARTVIQFYNLPMEEVRERMVNGDG